MRANASDIPDMRLSKTFVAFVTVLSLLFGAQALAAKRVPDLDALGIPGEEEGRRDPLVERIQSGLAEAGFYLGPINGILNRETEAAIRAFQKRSGFPVDPKVTERLAQQLETGQKVQLLLQRLQTTRAKNIEQARKLLMSREATRSWLEKPVDDVADPTRDPTPCFRAPEPACLLAEAAESAKAIPKPDMRDWARGEVLVAQAKAGLIPEAMDTARRVQDPRLIMVALKDIAEGRARAGQGAEALAAVDIIPDSLKQGEALAAIATLQANRGDAVAARGTVDRLLVALGGLSDSLKRVSFQARGAVALARIGDEQAALANLETAEANALRESDRKLRDMGLRYVASALAEIGRPDEALDMLPRVQEETDRTPILISAANEHVRTGDVDRALEIAERIGEDRYQAVVLCRIANALAGSDRIEDAETLVGRANTLTRKIKLPFARDFAISHVALSLAELGISTKDAEAARGFFDEAVTTAGRINDNRLRAQTFWSLSARRGKAGDDAGAKETRSKARDSSFDIRSALSRTWMFGDIAVERAIAGKPDAAITAFRSGLKEAAEIDNAWARARALAKMSNTLTDLLAQGITIKPRPE